jgi:hypothetical protein
MKNSFGIFVIHKALILAKDQQKDMLANKLKDSLALISNKKLKDKWCQILEESKQGLFKGSPFHDQEEKETFE